MPASLASRMTTQTEIQGSRFSLGRAHHRGQAGSTHKQLRATSSWLTCALLTVYNRNFTGPESASPRAHRVNILRATSGHAGYIDPEKTTVFVSVYVIFRA